MKRRRRDIRISVSRKNEDIFPIWQAIQAADPNPSSTLIKWIRERYIKEWNIKPKTLSPRQQEPVIKQEVIKRPPTEAELALRKKREEDMKRQQEEEKRKKAAELESIRRIIRSEH